MKKQMSMLVSAAIVFTLLAGCGGKETQVESGAVQDTQIPVENQETKQTGKSEADDLAETISLERYEEDNCVTYYLNGQEVSSSIYENEYEKFFDTYEVYDPVMDTEIVDEGSSATEL